MNDIICPHCGNKISKGELVMSARCIKIHLLNPEIVIDADEFHNCNAHFRCGKCGTFIYIPVKIRGVYSLG